MPVFRQVVLHIETFGYINKAMKINILALDSASSICGVSVLSSTNGVAELHSAQHSGSTQHAERILPLVEQTLATANLNKQDLSAIAFAQGPGGFTGLRVACGVAQGLAYALELKVAPVSSLLAIAAQQPTLENGINPIELVLVDARMQELYVAAYQRTKTGWYHFHKPILIGMPQLHHYIRVLLQQQEQLNVKPVIRISGDALVAFEDLQQQISAYPILFGNTDLAHSETIAQLGLLALQQSRLLDPALAAPLYVRNRVAFTIAERETGLGGNPSATWQSVQIRAMQLTDLAAVAVLETQLQPVKPWSAMQFQSSLEAGHWGWVATFNHDVVAYALLMPSVDECELLLIGVSPEHQRQGIAQQLLSYAEQHARSKGCTKVHLEVRATNQTAIALYQGADYYPVGLRKAYYSADLSAPDAQREDAILYTKIVA